jgi:cytochrome c553
MACAMLLVVAPPVVKAQAGSAAQTPAALYLSSLAANCASCHPASSGRAAHDAIATLAGLPREALAGSLREFRSGARPATVMQQISKGFSDAQIDAIAGYLAAQRKVQP